MVTGRRSFGTSQQSTSTVDFHRGEVLWALANTYPSLMLTLVEAAQNGIDADADRIFIGIDLRGRNVYIVDNGVGVTRGRFEQALASVGKGVKDKDKLGRFGRGLIAPLNKCKRFTFSSVPIGQRKAQQWTFIGEDIRRQHAQLVVPLKELPTLPSLPRWMTAHATGEFAMTWRTMVSINGITKDRVVSIVDLDELESQVRQKLGQAMRRKNISIRVVLIDENGHEQCRDIDPVAYTGQPLDVVSYTDAVTGEVQFELYRATKLRGQRRGEVVVMEMDGNYPITMKEFENQARGGGWTEILGPALAALKSGYFEGIIRCKNIELAPERTKFEYNEALQSLYLVITQWFEECGKKHFDDEVETTREQRYQDLGVKSQQRLREVLLNRPEFMRLWDSLKQVVTHGRLGIGHLDPEHGRPNGLEDEPSIRAGQGGAGTGRNKGTGGNTGGSSGKREPKDRPGDIPTGVTGPRGQRRQLVRGDSQGLWFEYSWMEGSSRLWEFDFERGILSFNVRHPIWVLLDETAGRHTQKNARQIMALQEWLALEVLTLLTFFKTVDELEQFRGILDTKIRPHVELFILAAPSR